jgi:hypothetical protein
VAVGQRARAVAHGREYRERHVETLYHFLHFSHAHALGPMVRGPAGGGPHPGAPGARPHTYAEPQALRLCPCPRPARWGLLQGLNNQNLGFPQAVPQPPDGACPPCPLP